MSNLFFSFLLSFFALMNTSLIANEGTDEPQAVVDNEEAQEEAIENELADTPQVIEENTEEPQEAQENTENAEEDNSPKPLLVPEKSTGDDNSEPMSEDEKEAQQAEESEMVEVGAGEEALEE